MTRALHGFHWFSVRRPKTETSSWKQQTLATILILFLLASAFSVIYLKDLSRRLFIQYENLQQTQQQQEVDRSKLLLEEGAWSTQARIQQLATTRLNMSTPTPNQIVMLQD